LLLDIAELESGADLRAQFCIIGAGAAGITLARRLAAKRFDVVLLESGGEDLEDEVQALYEGEAEGVSYLPLDSVRLRYLGGTTNHWEGQSVPLDRLDFERRGWVPGSGWPIAYEEYRRYVAEAQSLCEVSKGPFDYARAFPSGGVPAPPELPGFAPVLLRYSEPPTPFGIRYRQDLADDANIRCCLHATCFGLVPDDSGSRVAFAEAGSLDGRRLRIVADRYVLATGAIENSRLLHLSRRRSGVSLGNDFDQVGRYFMEHPAIDLGDIVLGHDARTAYLREARFHVAGTRFRRDIRLAPEVQAEEQILNHSVFLTENLIKPVTPENLGEQIVRLWDRVGARIFGEFGTQGDDFVWRIRLEHAPHAASRVTLADRTDPFGLRRAKIEFHFGELERRTISRVQERLASALGQTGLGRMKIDSEEWLDRYVERLAWQNHHLGGTRMNDDPRHGVADANCRVHGTRNLYVAGASVFPTSGHANPTMNLVALTLRLADHLMEATRG
jgi:choline dehydrogenase-like flavoprotein